MQKNSLLGEYDLKSVYFYILKKYFRKNRENIITCMLRAIIAVIGVLGYFIIANNYVHQKICMKSNSFMWVSLSWFVLTILLCFRVQIMHRHFTKRRKLTWIYALIVPLVSLYMEEKIWNLAIKELSILTFLLNYFLILIITIALLLITTKSLLTYVMVSFLCYIYGIINYYVLEFKGCPPLFNDLTAVGTALTVVGQYSYWLSDSVIFGTLVFIGLFTCLLYFTPADIKIHEKRRQFIIHAGGCLGFIAILIIIFHINIQNAFGTYINAWAPVESFYSNGAPVTMLISAQNMQMNKPNNYSDKEIQEILGAYKKQERASLDKIPTVIVIMNESFADLSVLGEITSDEYLSNFYGIDSYIMRGNTYASVCGGGTCNSEFEFLTGNSMANISAGVYPYQSWNLSKAFNLVEVFSECGYETIAMHPYIADNWNRVKVYDWFGFDRFISEEEMPDAQYISWGASDEFNYEQIIQLYENKTKPLFLFNITMQNHGGYDIPLRSDIDLISVEKQYENYGDLINYLTLMRESDKAFIKLLEYFSEQDDPVLICMFGDHQPALDDVFISSLGEYSEIADIEKRYITPYIIWGNYDFDLGNENKDMSINYLGANLLKIAGIHSEYMEYLLDLEKEIPIINQAGYQTADEKWHDISEENDKLNEYKALQYYELFER